jgi:hypothetical protein
MVIQIDVHPAGETRPTHHTHPTFSLHMAIDHTYLTWSTYNNISQVVDRVGQSHCSREKGIPDYIPNTSADRSVGLHPVSLPLTTIEVVKKATQLSTTG